MISITSFNGNGMRNLLKLEQFLFSCSSDIICLQETCWTDAVMDNVKTKWRELIYVNNGSEKSCGVAILIRKGVVENVKQVMSDDKGRVLVVEFEYQDFLFKLINVYAPNIEPDRKDLFERLKPLSTGNCVLVGDFNFKCCRMDAVSNAKFKYDSSRTVFLKMMNENDLVDKWREDNPNKRAFSRRQVVMGELKQSRIDLCIVKREISKYIKQTEYKFTSWSDHAMLSFRISVKDDQERGGGIWCLNSSLLMEEKYRSVIQKCIQYEADNPLMYSNASEWWETLKKKIKTQSMRYAKQSNLRKKQEERELREKLSRETENAGNNVSYNIENYLKIKAELDKFEKNKCMGAIVRSRAQYAVDGEKCTSFFLGLEKTKQRRNYINELENKNGERVSDFVSIIETVESFYRDLFKKSDVDNDCVENVLDKVTVKINESEKQLCDDDILIEEVKKAINSIQPNKSPGSDGLTGEFYKTFSDVLAPILLRVFRHMEEKQVVSTSMSTGVLTILYKNRGSKLKLENYRPISLLNNDYKIIAKILANRLKKVLGSIISSTQAYSVPGRDIADIICTMRDVIHHMNNDGEGGFVLNIDLNKAFDRVEHNFLFKAMESYGFGPRLIAWIQLLYSNARSCVKCNGVLTDTFPLERSVRQGCPLSAILYSISTEPLATLVKNDTEIQCVRIPGNGESVIQQYADDTSFTVRNMVSIKRIMGHLDVYGRASGAKINIEKSEIMYVGRVETQGCDIPFRVAKDFIKILGVNLGVKEKEARDLTWTGVLNKIKQVMNFWKQRGLKLKGKVVVINALVLSKCNYVLSAIDLPEWVINEINNAINDFLWMGKGVRISSKTLIANYEEGGLKLVDLNIKRKAIRVKTVKKYLYGEVDYGWKNFFREYINQSSGCGETGLLMSLKKTMYESVPDFYKEVFSAWGEFLPHVNYECNTIDLIIYQPLFLNHKIQNEGKFLYDKMFMGAGIKQVKDVVYEYVPGFLPEQAIVDFVLEWNDDIRARTVVNTYGKIKSTLPECWSNRIQNESIGNRLVTFPALFFGKREKRKELGTIIVKTVYRTLLEKEIKAPASENVWPKLITGMDVKVIWQNLNVKYNSIECEDLDFKLRHNRIYNNVVLHQINKSIKRECDVCCSDPESLMHMFVECKELKAFQVRLKDFLKKNWKSELVDPHDWNTLLLFGICSKSKVDNINLLNYAMSHARLAIWLRRNMAHFEGKKVKVWAFFEAIIRRSILLVSQHLDRLSFDEYFVKGSEFVSRNGSDKLVFNF